jgi:signal transduction histidine kinase
MNKPMIADRPKPAAKPRRHSGSLTRRMIVMAAVWIAVLLGAGGYALDRVLTSAITSNFDAQLDYVLTALIASAEIGPDGEVILNRPPADQRFLEPNSGLYFQIGNPARRGTEEAIEFPSRSLWDRRLQVGPLHSDLDAHFYDSTQFQGELIRVVERDVRIPGSQVRWRFQVAQNREGLDEQIEVLRRTLVRSFGILGLGLVILAALQTVYGLWPLRRVRQAIASIRSGEKARIDDPRLPREIAPLTDELNALLVHNEVQAEEARTHAGNLAHALKTPLTVITNAANAGSADLPETVCREAATMRRQVDHHLARARAVGRRASAQARAEVWPSLEAVERAVSKIYDVTIDLDGDKQAAVRVERQDLDEMVGNLIENAAKYGGGRVFVTVRTTSECVEIDVEDDGRGIPEAERAGIFDRGARLDTGKPGTGLGLAIVRDVARIYEGSVTLEESEDLGGLLARLKLPLAG